MLEFIDGFRCVEIMTLTGKKIIAGDANSSSYVLIKREKKDDFLTLIDLIKNKKFSNINNLPKNKIKLALELEKRGYLNTKTLPKSSFNEVNKISKILYKKVYDKNSKKDYNIFFTVIFFSIIVAMGIFVFANIGDFLNISKAKEIYSSLNFFDAFVCLTIMPFFILLVHELFHYLVAKLLGIEIASFEIGFFVVYPIVYLTYKGLFLNKTIKKILLLLGGVCGHIFLAFIGIFFYLNFDTNSQILMIFIISNISMIFTNLLPFGVSDGYFILSSILGIFNLRLAGYRAINLWMKGFKTTRYDTICGCWFLIIWVFAFISSYKMLAFLQNYFCLPSIFSIIILGIMVFKFIRKIYKLKF
jgi:hypothetical protein